MTAARDEVLSRYRRLREIAMQHHGDVLNFLARPSILEHTRRLGLRAGEALRVEFTLILDLAIYTAKEGRSRAIDRYARAVQLPIGSDERRMLEAMCDARFSIWRIKSRHDTYGLVVTDLLRESEAWLVDEDIEATARDGMCFASRVCDAGPFAMTSGVLVPMYRSLLEEVLNDGLACRQRDPKRVADDPRFAAAIYRAALDDGIAKRVVVH